MSSRKTPSRPHATQQAAEKGLAGHRIAPVARLVAAALISLPSLLPGALAPPPGPSTWPPPSHPKLSKRHSSRCRSLPITRRFLSFLFRKSKNPISRWITAAATNHHQFSGLKQHRFTILQFWRSGVQNKFYGAKLKALARLRSF